MQKAPILEQLGLTKHESRIYALLLRLGESTAVTLAKEANLHRRTVYDTLESLQKKGLAHVKIKKFVKHYAPASPQALQTMLEEKQALLGGLLPDLMRQFQAKEKKVSVRVFEGLEGMKTVLLDTIKIAKKKKDELRMIGAGLKTPEYLKYSFPHYVKQLKKMKWRQLQPDLPRIRKALEQWKIPLHCRYLPKKYLSPVGLLVYENRTVIMLLDDEPILILITGEHYARAFKNYFELLWQAAKP